MMETCDGVCDSDVHDGVCLCVTLLCMMVCVMVACDGGV